MRSLPVSVLLVVLVLFTVTSSVVAAAAAAAGPAQGVALSGSTDGKTATVSGTVVTENGTSVTGASVLLEPVDGELMAEYTDGGQDVAESLLKLAETDPDGLTVARTDDDGRFSASVAEGRYRVVAVTRERLSPLREVDATGGATVDLAVNRHQVLHVDAERAGPVAPGNTTTVAVRIENPDDDPVRSLSVTVGDLPSGWTLAEVETGGRYDAGAGRITWDRVDPNETAVAHLRIDVPEDAERGRHRVPLTATSDEHFVEQFGDGTVVVRPADATPTPTVAGGDANTTATPRVTGALTTTPTDQSPAGATGTPTTVPGFGLVVAPIALLVWALRLRATESR